MMSYLLFHLRKVRLAQGLRARGIRIVADWGFAVLGRTVDDRQRGI